MHRRLLALLAVIVPLALSALPSSAGGFICPVPTQGAQPCCAAQGAAAKSAATCCSTACCASADIEPACPVSRLTISSTPDPSVAGRAVRISGRMSGSSSATTVSLWQKLPGQSGFTRVAQTTTNGAGDYTFVRGAGKVLMNSTWYTTDSGATSPTLLQRVSALIKLAAAPARPGAGKSVSFSGRVSPAHGGERIVLQQRAGKRWRTIATGTLSRQSKFVLRHKFLRQGVAVVRVVLTADARNVQSSSSVVRVSVR